ncbi:hypothetical protein [Paenibacillus amylolyticus]|uniref:hypothetical protein n=1 Tax=Paenibacillus amylolyticus TaxID=1451 RepID=UPI00201E29A2|nr:hypothetical protein [Paenibacillus amylolyticus]MCL6661792.1 hypothetical protein [Paenibacillus amylolyticus]
MYNKQEWKDEIPDLTKPIMDQSTGKQKTDPQTGRPLFDLVQEGTRITSSRLNTMEGGIEAAHTLVEKLGKETAGNFVAVINGVMGLSCSAQGLKVTWTTGVAYVGGRRYEVTAGEMALNPTQGQYVYVDNNGVVNKTTSQATAKAGLSLFYVSTDTSGVISSEDRRVNLNIEELRKRIESVENDIITKTNSAERNSKNYTDERVGPLPDLKTNAKGNAVLAINELFTSVSNGKEVLANAITDMGQTTLASASFSVMANNITKLSTSTLLKEWRQIGPMDYAPGVLTHVISGNGVYVAIGSTAGELQFSNNGLSWRPAILPAGFVNSGFVDILFSDLQFVAVGYGKNIFTSNNGLNWTQISGFPSETIISQIPWTAAAYTNGRYCIMDGVSTLTSIDGVLWSFHENSIVGVGEEGSRGLHGGNGTFLTMVDTTDVLNKLLYSDDGINWYSATSDVGSFTFITAFAYGDQGWIGITATEIYKSQNGIQWSRSFHGISITGISAGKAIYAEGVYMIVGNSRNLANANRASVFTSEDGFNWKRAWYTETAATAFMTFVHSPGLFLYYYTSGKAGAFTGTMDPVRAFDWMVNNLSDLRSTFSSTLSNQLVTTPTSVGFDVMVSNIARIPRNLAATDWIARNYGSPARTVMAVVFGKGRFVAVGRASGNTGTVLISTDVGNSFSFVSAPNVDFSAVAYNDAGLFLAVGNGSSQSFAAAYSTNGGLSWSTVSPSVIAASTEFVTATWTGTEFICITRSGLVYTTPNGTSWTLKGNIPGLSSSVVEAAYGPAGLVVITESDVYFTSDITKWTKTLKINGGRMRGVAYGNGRFVIVTMSPTIVNNEDGTTDMSKRGEALVSTDNGLTWKYVMMSGAGGFNSTNRSFTDIIFYQGLFIASSSASQGPTFAVSHNGDAWSARTKASSSGTNVGLVAAGGGVILAFQATSDVNYMTSGTVDKDVYNLIRGN